MDFKKLAEKAGVTISRNSPMIFTALAVGGVVATAVMATKATIRAMETSIHMDEEYISSDNEEPLTFKDYAKEVWPEYIPTVIFGVFTIACIVAANSAHMRRNAAIVSAYTLGERTLNEYRARVEENLGPKKTRALKDDISKDRIEKNPHSTAEVTVTPIGESLCYDALGGRYFTSDIEKIRQACNVLSRNLMTDMFIPLNEVYSELGLKGTLAGDHIGWHIDDGLIEPDFSSQLTDGGAPCLVMDFEVPPRYGYNTY